MSIQFKNESAMKTMIGVTLFLFTFYNVAWAQITIPLMSTMIKAEGWTNPTLSNLVVTIGALMQIPALLIGAVLGKRMNKKLFSCIALAATLIGCLGVVAFGSSIYLVLGFRALIGFGAGLGTLLSTAWLPDFFKGKELSKWFGLVLAGSGLWGFVLSNISGAVCATAGWKAAYMLHFLILIPMLMIFLVIPNKPLVVAEQIESASDEASSAKGGFNPMVLTLGACGMLIFMFILVLWSNISIWVTDIIGGTVAQAGLAASVISLTSFLGRLMYGKIYNTLKTYTLHLDIALLVTGLFIAHIASGFGFALVAIGLVGLTMGLCSPTVLNMAVEISPASQVRAQSIVIICIHFGNFISTYWRLVVDGLGDGTLLSAFRINTYFAGGLLIVAFVGSFISAAIAKNKA